MLSYLRIDLSAKVLTLAMFVEILIVVAFNITVPVSQGLSNVSFEPLSPSHALVGNFTPISAAAAHTNTKLVIFLPDWLTEQPITAQQKTHLAKKLILSIIAGSRNEPQA
ncbi:hypothetical protein [Pseudomonas coleopterorum]|uniref:hypothetical protein n=1 Tax=Pseudomonas coleopterorum TaxID=1605838 RepID=UPI001782FD4B|nr:hypothetical protein [Pseudomonas coleopterorum]MBD8480384.1 hypothetical protein [Pseudomonas coleopterorum]